MAKKVITEAFYKALVDGFRATPSNHAAVARHVRISTGGSCDRATCARAWRYGWPNYGFKPVQETLIEEESLARAARWELEAKARERIAEEGLLRRRADIEAERLALLSGADAEAMDRLRRADQEAAEKIALGEMKGKRRMAELLERANSDAVEQRADEAMLAKSARKNALSAQAFMAMSWQSAKPLADRVVKAVNDPATTLAEVIKLADTLAKITKAVNEATKTSIEIERLRVGDPTSIVGVQMVPASIEEAGREIEEAAKVLAVARRRLEKRGTPIPVVTVESEGSEVEPGSNGSGSN